MYTPSIPEMITTHMLTEFGKSGIEDTIENRISFLKAAREFMMSDPVFQIPANHFYMHVAVQLVIIELEAEQRTNERLNK